jgi:hypothetical protein
MYKELESVLKKSSPREGRVGNVVPESMVRLIILEPSTRLSES